MAASRAVRPMLTSSSRFATRQVLASKRFLNADTAPVLYKARAHVTGGRNGNAEGAEGLTVGLSMPTSLGGKSTHGRTNPEELLAAGYGACFQSAMVAVSGPLNISIPESATIDTSVSLVGSLKELDMGLRIDMEVKAKGISKEDLEKVVAKAEEVCPYSRATKGNVTTNVTVTVE